MKALKVILIIILVIFAGYCIWMATLPKDFTMERTAMIDAEPEAVFAEVNDLREWPKWSPWYEMDTTVEMKYSDDAVGEGAYYTWESEKDNVGAGKYTNIAVTDNESIDYNMEFEGMGGSDGYWKFEGLEDDKTKVTWGFHTEFGFFDRVGGVFIEQALGPQFDEGLENLKTTVEKMPKQAVISVEVAQVEPMEYYGIKEDIPMDTAMSSNYFGSRFGAIMAYLGDDANNMTGAPLAIYYKWDEENREVIAEPGIPAQSSKPGNERITKGTTHGGLALKAVKKGSYDTKAEHEAIYAYAEKNNYEIIGSPWESFVGDPGEGENMDMSKAIVEVYYPIADPADAGEPIEPEEMN